MPRGGKRVGAGMKPTGKAMIPKLFDLRQDQVKRLKEYAIQKGISMGEVVRRAIDKLLGKN